MPEAKVYWGLSPHALMMRSAVISAQWIREGVVWLAAMTSILPLER